MGFIVCVDIKCRKWLQRSQFFPELVLAAPFNQTMKQRVNVKFCMKLKKVYIDKYLIQNLIYDWSSRLTQGSTSFKEDRHCYPTLKHCIRALSFLDTVTLDDPPLPLYIPEWTICNYFVFQENSFHMLII